MVEAFGTLQSRSIHELPSAITEAESLRVTGKCWFGPGVTGKGVQTATKPIVAVGKQTKSDRDSQWYHHASHVASPR
jgi:hypothetical protein